MARLVVRGRRIALLVTSLYRAAIATSHWKARSFLPGLQLPRRRPRVCVRLVLLLRLHSCLRPARLLPTSLLVLRVWHLLGLPLLRPLLLLRRGLASVLVLHHVPLRFLPHLRGLWLTNCVPSWRHGNRRKPLQQQQRQPRRQKPSVQHRLLHSSVPLRLRQPTPKEKPSVVRCTTRSSRQHTTN